MKYETPIWLQKGRALRQYPWQDGDVRTEVCVIGGGVTGALCALLMTQQGRAVTLLSRSPIGRGATSRQLPVSLCDSGINLRTLVRRCGRETAMKTMQLAMRAADELEQLCSGFVGGAGFSRRDSVIYAASETDADQLHRDYHEYRREGFECMEMNRSAFGSAFAFPAYGALVMADGAVEVDPYLLAQQAASHAADNGAVIFENTCADRISSGSDGRVTVSTSTCRTVTADCVVIAAGAACAEILTGIAPGRSRYIAASRPLRAFHGWPGRCAVRSYAEPDIVCATTPDERLIISSAASAGAESRERFRGALRLSGSNERRYGELEAAAQYMFPETGLSSFESGWTLRGIRTIDGLPVVGRTRSHPGCIFAVSGGEGGVLSSAMLARVVCEEAAGLEPEEIRLFTPGRRRLAG